MAKGEDTEDDRLRVKNAQDSAAPGGTETQRRLRAAKKRMAKGEDTEDDRLRIENSMAYAAAAVKKNRATTSSEVCDRYDRFQASNAQKKAKFVERTGMVTVTKSTPKTPKVTCKCEKCGDLRLSGEVKPAKNVGNDGRNIFVYSVDSKGRKMGEPRIVDGVSRTQAKGKAIGANWGKIKAIIDASEEGGLLKKHRTRKEDLWLQYEPRPENILIAPMCITCRCNTHPTDLNFLRYRDYISYRSGGGRF